MGRLYLVRHGETLFNVQHKIQGWCDSPLTARGIAQAKRLAAYFDPLPLDHAYSSTAERAVDTAELIIPWPAASLSPEGPQGDELRRF